MKALNGATTITGSSESTQGLSFITSDNKFRVIDGGRNGNFNSDFLASFSVSSDLVTGSVPEPSNLLLAFVACVLLGYKKFSY